MNKQSHPSLIKKIILWASLVTTVVGAGFAVLSVVKAYNQYIRDEAVKQASNEAIKTKVDVVTVKVDDMAVKVDLLLVTQGIDPKTMRRVPMFGAAPSNQ